MRTLIFVLGLIVSTLALPATAQELILCNYQGREYGCVDLKTSAYLDFIINHEVVTLDSTIVVLTRIAARVDTLAAQNQRQDVFISEMWDKLDSERKEYKTAINIMSRKIKRKKFTTRLYQGTIVVLTTFILIENAKN